MCGICGIIHSDKNKPIEDASLKHINRTMIRRGPDDEGYYIGDGVGIAMRRLSILDVSHGAQPFFALDDQIISVCNGEIYNYQQIRDTLIQKGHSFRSNSDAEVIPPLYLEDDMAFVQKLNGMFGLCIWDERQRKLILARDRMGQKSLYYTYQNGIFVFGSELNVIANMPNIDLSISHEALSKYLAYEYIPAPSTIYKGVYKLEPGQILTFQNNKISVNSYWDVPVSNEYSNISLSDAANRLTSLLDDSVQKRLISDVPLGVFLSGGIDSSAIVSQMAKLRDPSTIKTFSIAFSEKSFDESSYARQVANHFGTDHHEQMLSATDLLDLIPEVSMLMDEPLADASIIPTYALSKFTRKHVTVALGGDGGDELFAGYPTFQADMHAQTYNRLPKWLCKGLIEPCIRALPVNDGNISFDFNKCLFGCA